MPSSVAANLRAGDCSSVARPALNRRLRRSTGTAPQPPEHPLPQADPAPARGSDVRDLVCRSTCRVDVFDHDAQGLEVRLRRGSRRQVTEPINPIRKRNESHCVYDRESETRRRDTATTGKRHKTLCHAQEARYMPLIFERCRRFPTIDPPGRLTLARRRRSRIHKGTDVDRLGLEHTRIRVIASRTTSRCGRPLRSTPRCLLGTQGTASIPASIEA